MKSTWASPTAAPSSAAVHAMDVDPSGPHVEEDFRPGHVSGLTCGMLMISLP